MIAILNLRDLTFPFSIPSSLESSTEPGEEEPEEESDDEPMDRGLRNHSPVKRRRSYYQALEPLPESETDKVIILPVI